MARQIPRCVALAACLPLLIQYANLPAQGETQAIPYRAALSIPTGPLLLVQQDAPPAQPAAGGKSPVLALALSTLLAGTGQFYNGDWLKGVVQLVGHLGGIPLFILGGLDGLNGRRSTFGDFLLYGGISMTLGLKLWSMVDAPLSAERINYEAQQQHGSSHLLQLSWGSAALSFDPVLSTAGAGASARLDF